GWTALWGAELLQSRFQLVVAEVAVSDARANFTVASLCVVADHERHTVVIEFEAGEVGGGPSRELLERSLVVVRGPVDVLGEALLGRSPQAIFVGCKQIFGGDARPVSKPIRESERGLIVSAAA